MPPPQGRDWLANPKQRRRKWQADRCRRRLSTVATLRRNKLSRWRVFPLTDHHPNERVLPMHDFRAVLVAGCVLTSLAACAGDMRSASAPPLENFDPSQVRMLPNNPYRGAPANAAAPALRS